MDCEVAEEMRGADVPVLQKQSIESWVDEDESSEQLEDSSANSQKELRVIFEDLIGLE